MSDENNIISVNVPSSDNGMESVNNVTEVFKLQNSEDNLIEAPLQIHDADVAAHENRFEKVQQTFESVKSSINLKADAASTYTKTETDSALVKKVDASDSTVTRQGNMFNGASQLLQLNSSGQLPAVDGSLLTAVPAIVANTSLSNITSIAKTSLNNAGIRTVVDSYVNGFSWYRVWSDGWIEQGGGAYLTNGTVTLLKAHKDTNYSVFLQASMAINTTISGGASHYGLYSRTVSSFDVGFSYNGNTYNSSPMYWRTSGY